MPPHLDRLQVRAGSPNREPRSGAALPRPDRNQGLRGRSNGGFTVAGSRRQLRCIRLRLGPGLALCSACGVLFTAACANLVPEAIITALPPADAEPGRWVVLEGANNTRDIGGYATAGGRSVRWKTLYRSGQLSSLSAAGCEAFHALDLQRVIDFRNRLSSSSLFGGDAPCVVSTTPVSLLPVRLENDALALPAYVQGVMDNSESYRRAFEVIADPASLPLLYHCAAGKDRSGILAALLLTLVGVDRDTVVADYNLSNLVGAEVDPQDIIDLLDEVERQAGIEAYLANLGVTAETQAAIRENLLE